MIGRALIAVAVAVSLSGCMLPFVMAVTATELKYESSVFRQRLRRPPLRPEWPGAAVLAGAAAN